MKKGLRQVFLNIKNYDLKKSIVKSYSGKLRRDSAKPNVALPASGIQIQPAEAGSSVCRLKGIVQLFKMP